MCEEFAQVMGKAQLISLIQSVIDSKYDGVQSAFAEKNGLSGAYVSDVLNGRREPGQKILKAVGVIRLVVYQQNTALPEIN